MARGFYLLLRNGFCLGLVLYVLSFLVSGINWVGGNLKNIRLSLIVPKSDDPSSYYRAFGPLGALRKTMGNLEFNLPSNFTWATMGVSDAVFMQRPADPACLDVANTAKIAQTPLWIDFDDDNLAVPISNETHDFFGRWEVKDTITKVSRLATVITVSTEFLKKKYSIYNKNILVIPNAINETFLHLRALIPKRPRDKVIIWRGGPGFHENLAEIGESMVKLAAANPTWKFIFMGHNPWQVSSRIKNHQFIGWMPYLNYLQTICQLHASAFVYCLADNDHSRSRSNISWLEATFAGSTLLAKNLPEFQKPGCLTFANATEFEEKLTAIMSRQMDLDAVCNESWEYICEHYMLSKQNVIRRELLERLTS